MATRRSAEFEARPAFASRTRSGSRAKLYSSASAALLVDREPAALDTTALQSDRVGVEAGGASWMRNYRRAVVCFDLAAAFVAALASYTTRFVASHVFENLPYLELCAALPLMWVAIVGWNRAYERRFLAVGPDEYQRVLRAFLLLLASVSFVSYATKVEIARGFVVLAPPATALLSLLARAALRRRLYRRRAAGGSMSSVLLVGAVPSVLTLAATLRADTAAGMRVVGACIPRESAEDRALVASLDDAGIPMLGNIDSVCEAVNGFNIEMVAVTSSSEIGSDNLRWISWQLEETDADLVVAPGLIEVAGSRLHVRPVAGLPLLHVEKPEFVGFRRVVKSLIDRTVAAGGLLLLAPLLAVLAVLVKVSSRGPVLFRQTRVGVDGSTFTMLKFRSMVADAEARREALHLRNDHGDSVLFKMRQDPRITPIGRILRKFSLDELPQLFNVVVGSMSLVGPRPPLPSEVENYAGAAHRRLLVKPGLTGLWQVSGRSALSWDESVRLDLRYVENWSPALDFAILFRTAATVIRGKGAY